MVKDETDEVIKGSFDSLKIDIQIILNQWKVAILFLIIFSYCIIIVIK